jgi:hypothetical protein
MATLEKRLMDQLKTLIETDQIKPIVAIKIWRTVTEDDLHTSARKIQEDILGMKEVTLKSADGRTIYHWMNAEDYQLWLDEQVVRDRDGELVSVDEYIAKRWGNNG